jgi:hypothetical protein
LSFSKYIKYVDAKSNCSFTSSLLRKLLPEFEITRFNRMMMTRTSNKSL